MTVGPIGSGRFRFRGFPIKAAVGTRKTGCEYRPFAMCRRMSAGSYKTRRRTELSKKETDLRKLLENKNFPLSVKYDSQWVLANEMGPNALWLTGLRKRTNEPAADRPIPKSVRFMRDWFASRCAGKDQSGIGDQDEP